MHIEGRRILVLGGYGLVGTAVCRHLLAKGPAEIVVHSLRAEEAERAVAELAPVAGGATLTARDGDILGLVGEPSAAECIAAQVRALDAQALREFRLYRLLAETRPDVVVDCVNTATAIAYRDLYRSAERLLGLLETGTDARAETEALLEGLYVPRLTRHIQVLYQGMIDAGTKVYVKIGTSGTGGMGLNIPYTHSEERPSRVLLSKSALGGAHSMLLFLMARTPGAPITKEIKPAAAIAWKRIGFGPIVRRGVPLQRVRATPRPLPARLSSEDPAAAEELGRVLESVYMDTGENGLFSLEEFSALSSAEQMEFVTPEEIAQYLVSEIEGGNTGYDVIGALDQSVLGPTYRAGDLRHHALSLMAKLEKEHGVRSVAFEMLGPPRVSKLLFEAHVLREACETMAVVRDADAAELTRRLDELVRSRPDFAADVVAVGIPILLANGELLRARRVLVPGDAIDVEVTPARLETWVEDGWVDLRERNVERWIERFRRLAAQVADAPAGDTSSRHLGLVELWSDGGALRPGEVVGWILSGEERGGRIKA